jgi:methyl acetate hydrolase
VPIEEQAVTSTTQTALREALADAVERSVVPGAVAVLVGPGGPRAIAAAGRRRIDAPEPVAADTVFAVASMTKPLTAAAVLQLIERGALGIDQDVSSILPAYGGLRVLEGFDAGEPLLRRPRRSATVRELLTHTAGHAYWFCNEDILRFSALNGLPEPFSGRRAMLDAPLVADPGQRWEYGTSFDWLGQVVEAVSGRALDAYLSEHVFAPLGMRDTTFRPSAEQRGRLMPVYDRARDGGLRPSAVALPADPEIAAGGHGVFSTGHDYARFLTALLRDGELDGVRVLAPESVELMFSDHLDGVPLPALVPSAVPRLTNDMPSLPVRQGFGLGVQLVLEDVPGMRTAGAGFWAGLFNSYFWVDRGAGVGGALLTQLLPFFDEAILSTFGAIEQAAYRRP